MKPTHDDFRAAARVLRHCLDEFGRLPWWKRLMVPMGTIAKLSVVFDQMADDGGREGREEAT